MSYLAAVLNTLYEVTSDVAVLEEAADTAHAAVAAMPMAHDDDEAQRAYGTLGNCLS